MSALTDTARRYVLVVEDDMDSNELLVSQFQRAGWDAAGVDDGTTAMEAVAERRPDLMCVDLGLPLVSGFELCAWVRRHPELKDMPLLIVTGRTSFEDIAHASEVGADEIVCKPYRRTDLLAAARRLLQPSREATR